MTFLYFQNKCTICFCIHFHFIAHIFLVFWGTDRTVFTKQTSCGTYLINALFSN
ncbi:hypothetical protein HanRHA438_Chr02g0084341 [Helianthus annuus]|nr:hypothetical protein HanRHA438_Chr02g0084341 [Helianthus annuus]